MIQSELSRDVSPKTRKYIGIACCSVGIALGIASIISQDLILIALVAGLPIGLVGLSLLAGRAKEGKGIFSSFTLYFIGICILTGSVAGIYQGQLQGIWGLFFSMSCFLLARKRKTNT